MKLNYLTKINYKKPLICFLSASGIWVSSGFVNTASGQVAFAIGPKAGYAITSFEGDGASFEAKASWTAGLFANLQLHPVFTLQPELLFSEKGAISKVGNTRTDVRLKYFEVPVLAKFRIPVKNVFFPHLLLGPNFAFNTDAKYAVTDTQTGEVIQWNGGEVTKTDIGALIGAGFDVQAGALFFTMDGRYGYGFNQLNENTLKIRNVGWTFSAGVGIRFGDKE